MRSCILRLEKKFKAVIPAVHNNGERSNREFPGLGEKAIWQYI